MNNKMMFEYVAIVFVAALLATLATVPLKYAAAQNATMP
jgi:ABC-type phosphate/phosphonate transport system permease subunit